MLKFRPLLFALIVGALPALPASAQPAADDFRIERTVDMLHVEPGQRLHLSNAFGDVRLRYGGDSGDLELRSALQQFAHEGAPLQVRHTSEGDTLHIVVDYDGGDGRRIAQRQPGQKRRVDLAVLVPKGVDLDVDTTDGLIELRGLRSNARVRTIDGDIRLRQIQGDLDLETVNGRILAPLRPEPRTNPQRFATSRGVIRLLLNEDGHYATRIHGDGVISTEFPLRFSHGEKNERLATTRYGKGTTPVEIFVGDGELQLDRKPSATLAADYSDLDQTETAQ